MMNFIVCLAVRSLIVFISAMILSSTAAAGIPPTPEKLLPPLPPT
jgi:hypothetical protein